MRNIIPKRNPEDRHPISHPIPKAVMKDKLEKPQQAAARALASAKLAEEAGHARLRYYQEAVEFLRTATPSTAVERMRTLPLALMEMFLVAEQENLNRKEVLMYFPKPGSQAKEKWLGPVAKPKKKRATKKVEPARTEEDADGIQET